MKKLIYILLAVGAIALSSPLFADGCYICTSGSSDNCRDYCRYSGSDDYSKRKACENAGCKVGGTASCPTAVNYKVCSALNTKSFSEQLALQLQN